MKKLFAGLMMFSSVFVLSACLSQKPSDFGEQIVEQSSDSLVIADKGNVFQVVLPSDYTFNNQAEIESISYGNPTRETYVLVFAEAKSLLPVSNMEDYFAIVKPGLDNIQVEELTEGTIPNPHGYTVQDYRITGSFNGIDLVWYQRILEQDSYFAQFNSWTLDTYEEQNKSELFSNISSLEWKDGFTIVVEETLTGTEEETVEGNTVDMNDENTTQTVSE